MGHPMPVFQGVLQSHLLTGRTNRQKTGWHISMVLKTTRSSVQLRPIALATWFTLTNYTASLKPTGWQESVWLSKERTALSIFTPLKPGPTNWSQTATLLRPRLSW